MKKDVSFFEAYAKVNYTINDNLAFGVNEYYSPNFLNSGAWGNYASITGKYTAPEHHVRHQRRRHVRVGRVRPSVARNFGRLLRHLPAFPNGIKYADYNTWNIGVGFTYKVFTLDLRYSDTDLSKGNCNAFTSDFTPRTPAPAQRHPDQPGRRRLQLVRRDRHRQALGRPDRDDQPEVSFFAPEIEGAAEQSAALFVL